MFQAFAIATILLLTGCGSSTKDLGPQEQYRFANALQNLARVSSVIYTTSVNHAGVSRTSNTGGQRDQDVDEMIGRMERAVTAGRCNISEALPLEMGIPSPDLKMV